MSRELLRYPNVVRSVVAGARSPLPPDLQHIASVDMSVTVSSLCLNQIVDEFALVTSDRQIVCTRMRKDLDLTRSDVLIYFSAFADSHSLPINKSFRQPTLVPEIIAAIETEHQRKERSVGLSEQLEFALDRADNDLTHAVLGLAVGTRAIARGQDTRLVPELEINRRRLFNWKFCVAPVGFEGATEDHVGDTYHFWHGVMAGMSTYDTEFPKAVCHAKSFVCEQMYGLTAAATKVLRYRVNKHTGRVHEASDKMGFAVGKHWQSQYGQGNVS